MIITRMSGQLRKLTNGISEINIDADDIAGCIDILENKFVGIKKKLFDEKGEVQESINIYINGDNIRSLEGLSTQLKDGDEVDIMSAFAAG